MFSGLLEPLRRNVGVRLSLLYALIFTLSSVALLALAYYLLAAAVGSKDREVLEARLKEAAVVYEAGGVTGLRSWVYNQPADVQNTMFVHLVNPFNNTDLVISAPEAWIALRDVPGWEGSPQGALPSPPAKRRARLHPGPAGALGRPGLADWPDHQQPRRHPESHPPTASCSSAA